MDVSHLSGWKRKWVVIHNTASLKTSIRWSLLSSLLIAWYSLCPREPFILEPIHSNVLQRPESLAAAITAKIHPKLSKWHFERVSSFPASLMAHRAALLLLQFQIFMAPVWAAGRTPSVGSIAIYRWKLGMMWSWSVARPHRRSRPSPGPRM